MPAWPLQFWAPAHGPDRNGFAIDGCDRAGRPRRAPRRRALDSILATDPAWLWIDRLGGSGRACGPDVPASTLYHLVVAFEELLRVAGRGRPDAL